MSQTAPEHLALTQYFINENPTSITISRRAKEPTGSGGWRYGEATDLDPFVGRLVGSFRLRDSIVRTTEAGQEVIPTHTLIAMPGEDIARGDQFTVDDVLYEVVAFNTMPKWRINAEVLAHG